MRQKIAAVRASASRATEGSAVDSAAWPLRTERKDWRG
jgi:hypothetical protein